MSWFVEVCGVSEICRAAFDGSKLAQTGGCIWPTQTRGQHTRLTMSGGVFIAARSRTHICNVCSDQVGTQCVYGKMSRSIIAAEQFELPMRS